MTTPRRAKRRKEDPFDTIVFTILGLNRIGYELFNGADKMGTLDRKSNPDCIVVEMKVGGDMFDVTIRKRTT